MAVLLSILCFLLAVSSVHQQPALTNYSLNCGEGKYEDMVVVRREKIREMMTHAWSNYVRYAWGENELSPVSKKPNARGTFRQVQLGATIINGLSTLYIMGMMEEFKQGRDWIDKNLDTSKLDGRLSVFQVTTQLVGGLLSCYTLTGDEMFRDKAVQIAEKLLPAFETDSGIPTTEVNLKTGDGPQHACNYLSDVGGLYLEFSYLSDVAGKPVFREKVDHVNQVLQLTERPQGLYPSYIFPMTGKWCRNQTSIGGYGDAFYEYLLKGWLQSGQENKQLRQIFDDAMSHLIHHTLKVSHGGHLYFGSYKVGRVESGMDQLACFSGGLLGLAARTLKSNMTIRYMEIAEAITTTCHDSYDNAQAKLGPQVFRFTESVEAKSVKSSEKFYDLRSEVIESYFYMWRLTKDQKYRDWGWEVVQALEQHCRVEGGYTGIRNVDIQNTVADNVQQPFFLAATLKYLYVLYSDDCLLSLDQWVFNTAGHPLPIKGVNPLYHMNN